eukprot:scaffold182988_cov52-Attheya_sp.AAC.3
MAFSIFNVGTAIGLWLVITTGGCLYVSSKNGVESNIWVTLMLFFNNLNLFIAICEIILGKHIMLIKSDYKKLKEKYEGREVSACWAFLFMPLTLAQAFDGRIWSKMWSTYALMDPSYQNHESFGFFIDVGNGYSTIPPNLLWNYAMMFPHEVSPLWVGCIGIASYWQILYGTIIYFLSYMFNQRYKGFPLTHVMGFVGVSNGIWFFFPLLGIAMSVCMLRDGNMSIFQ